MSSDHKTFEDLLGEIFREDKPDAFDELAETGIPLDDTDSQLLLMHRDAHFGGSFSAMGQYYQNEGIGALADFHLEDIERLAALEAAAGQDLATVLFTETCLEVVEKARQAYATLREVYDSDLPDDSPTRLIADLILSEQEEPEEEIQAIIAKGSTMIPLLMRVLEEPDFHDALAPGYGYAPIRAVVCLGRLVDKSAIVPLFEALGHAHYMLEDHIYQAFTTIGAPAKEFLLKVMQQEPVTQDNVRALAALIEFSPDHEVAKACLSALQGRPVMPNTHTVSLFLILGCEGLKAQQDRDTFRVLVEGMDIPDIFREDIALIFRQWDKGE